MTYGQMAKTEQRLKAEVKRWFEEADRIDREEDALYGEDNSGDEMPDWMSDKEERLKRIQQAKAELEAEAKAELEKGAAEEKVRHEKKPTGTPKQSRYHNFTDPESRLLKTRNGYVQGYNGQVGVDGETQVIVAQTLTDSSADVHQLIPLLKQIRSSLRRQAREVSADSAYCSRLNLKALIQHHIRGYIATDRQKKDQSVSPEVARMRQRLAQGGKRSRYRLRGQTVEPVFGQIKEVRGFRRFLLRGKQKVAAEWSLICTAHNLLKLQAASS